jgi:acyl-homoserine lactone acylase PvdQ
MPLPARSRAARLLRPLLPVLALASCAPLGSAVERVFPGAAVRMARSVTIHRDEWGVPHIYGPTDASVVFGMAYAQAEDNFWQVEEGFIDALGRRAELDGERALAGDLVRAAFSVERLSREEYAREPPERRRLWDAFAAGLNHYLATHPEARPRLITRYEPWFVFARFRSAAATTTVDGVRLGDVVATPLDAGAGGAQDAGGPSPEPPDVTSGEPDEAQGSNTWAVAPARTAAGHALLFQNPHVSFYGSGQRYEVHLQSDQGWHFSGFAILGTPMPRAGHNEHLGWSHTNSAADVGDAYEIAFDAADSLAYRHGAETRRAIAWEDTLLVRTAAGLEARRFRFLRTHHGPVVARPEGKPVAVRLARFEEGGSLQQWYAMSRATSLDEFRAALAQRALPISNTMYADRDGHILYVHGNAVPQRTPGFDWRHPVDGSDPRTDWLGYHELAELPQLLDPPSGWIQNTNSTPFLATAEGHNLRRDDYPAYMAPESDNGRARVSRAILGADSSWTFEEWARAAFDTRVIEADEHIPAIIDEWERLGANDPERTLRLDSAVHELRAWDRVSAVASVPMTLFLLWLERMRRPGADTAAFARAAALEQVIARLERDWGTQRVPWGDINRLQRIHTSGDGEFDDARPSLPVAGAPGWAGIVFNFTTRAGPDGKRRYGTSGHTWVSVVEFGPRVRARSVVTYGQSADPGSPHFFDQAALYAEGRLREAWFWREDVERQTVRSYRPGIPDAPRSP